MDSREKAILKTLLYSDFFNYPLKKEEIYKFLISDKKITRRDFQKAFRKTKMPIGMRKGFFFLTERKELVTKRERKEKASLKKLKKARKIVMLLSLLPTVKFIGISGALAMKNSDENDDIDIFVISKKGFVWTTRLLLISILSLLGVYRNRKSKDYSDKICLNMIIDETRLKFIKNNQDLYTAHEIGQLLPIFDKEGAYEAFIKANLWIKNFMPNILINKNYSKKKENILGRLSTLLFRMLFLEKITKFLQLSYMKNHITKEVVEDNFLKFHPFDYKTYILKKYNKKTASLGL